MNKNKKYNYNVYSKATKKCNARQIAIILGAIILGCVCIILSSFFSTPWETHDNWRILINTVFSTVATVVFAGVAWEGIAKYSFSRDVVDMTRISDRLIDSGVFAVEKSFSDVAWEELLEHATNITAIFTYSTRWGKDNREAIRKAVENGSKFTVILPDIKAPGVIDALKFRFNGVNGIEAKIEEARKYYSSLGAEVLAIPITIQSSYYLIDDVGIMAPFNHQQEHGGHTPSVPAFLALKPGYLFEYIAKEVEAIRGIAISIPETHKEG